MTKGNKPPSRGARVGRDVATSQAINDIRKETRRLDKAARELLQKSGKSIREVRGEVAKLKKAGLVSQRVDARSYVPTRYMLTKLRKNADVLRGEVETVKAPKDIRKKYVEKGLFEQRGSVLVVPKEYHNQRTKIKRGLVEISRPLGYGEERRVILPFKATDMEAVANKLRDDPTLDGLKEPDELFGFRLFGHNMATIGFPDADELADYILTRYQHLFSGKNGREAVKHFVLFRFKSRDSQLSDAPQDGKVYHPRKRTPQSDWYADRKRKAAAMRKKKAREKETPEQRQIRLDKQRIRSAQNRQRKFDEK